MYIDRHKASSQTVIFYVCDGDVFVSKGKKHRDDLGLQIDTLILLCKLTQYDNLYGPLIRHEH